MIRREGEVRQAQTNHTWLIYVELLLCALIIWCTFATMDGVVSLLLALSFLVLFVLFFTNIPLFADELFVLTCLIVLLSFFALMLSWGRYADAVLSFGALVNYIIFATTIFLCYILLTINVTENMAKQLLYIVVGIGFLFPIGRFWFGFKRLEAGYMDMNFSNPNLAGMFLMQAAVFSVLGVFLLKTPFWKCLCAVAALLNAQMITWTEARNALIAFFVFCIIGLWSIIKLRTRLPKWLVAAVSVFPIIFVSLYLRFIEFFTKIGFFSVLISENKSLTSREKIWNSCFDRLQGNYWTGDYFRLSGNTHNSHMVVLCSFGIVVLFLVMRFLYVVMVRVNRQCETRKQLICLAAFFGTVFMGLGEGGLFSGGVGINVISCMPLLLARFNWDKINADSNRSDRKGRHRLSSKDE